MGAWTPTSFSGAMAFRADADLTACWAGAKAAAAESISARVTERIIMMILLLLLLLLLLFGECC
jgi:hypothetical protein